jgi:hypothetical protein
MKETESDDGCPCLSECQEPRGSTDVLSNAFTFEKDAAKAIEARCGKSTSPQSGMQTPTGRNPWDR